MIALLERLTALVTEGGSGNRLVAQAPAGYLVFRAGRGQPEVLVEASAGRYQAPRLDEGQRRALYEAGFTQQRASQNFRRSHLAQPSALAAEAARLLAEVYDCEAPHLRLSLGDRERTANPQLLQAVENLAKKRSMAARQHFYGAALRARWVVPMQGGQIVDAGELSGTRVVAAYSDWDALLSQEPRGWKHVVLSGAELFIRLEAERVGSLLINPSSALRGELYRNEIQSVAEGARRMAH